jgi:acetyltransferase-like isoleucine patch superfamily enzyme
MIKKYFNKFLEYWHKRSVSAYINYLRKKGIRIGSNCTMRHFRTVRIDISRPSLITIGNDVSFNKDFELLTHDFAGGVFIRKYNDFIPAHKRVEIGNNVRFGAKCIVLSGAKIGDNCFIGAYSLVNKEIPSNSIAVGIPAKVICTIDEYYAKRKTQYIEEIMDYARSIQERFGRKPLVQEFYDDYPAFVDGSNFEQYDFPYHRVFNKEQFEIWKQNHKAPFKSFDEFLKAAGIK